MMVTDYLTLEASPKITLGSNGTGPPFSFKNNGGNGDGDNLPPKPTNWWHMFLANSLAILVSCSVGTTHQYAIKQPLMVEPLGINIYKPRTDWDSLNLN